jgi:polysaccharide deacetylase family protein (PEP-CTERM system associated)
VGKDRKAPQLNLLTIDLEDWYELTGAVFQKTSSPRPDLLERQVSRLLRLLADHNCRATFFCLGKSLSRCPRIIRQVAEAGHEIATHGWGHGRVYQIGLAAFREDLSRSIDWLSGLTGRQVGGYRAPFFSVTPDQLEGFFDICFEVGLRYDSSVYPFRGRSYGHPTAPRHPYIARQNGSRRLIEFPLATVNWLGRRWPIAGGGSWRVLPSWLIRSAVARCNREGFPAVIYLHPYEFDTHTLSVKQAVGPSLRATMWTMHQNIGRASIYHRLNSILRDHRFGAVEDYLHEQRDVPA